MYQRILVPLDGLATSEAIIPDVKIIAERMQSEMIFLHVVPKAVPEFAPPSRPLSKGFTSKQKVKLTRYLKTLCGKIEKEGARATYLIREGAVADTILEVAESMQADLIAMSTQGRSPAQIILLGNVTYQVVRRSPLPMLIIRSNIEPAPSHDQGVAKRMG